MEYIAELNSSYEDNISSVEDFSYQYDLSTATLMEEVCGLQGGLC